MQRSSTNLVKPNKITSHLDLSLLQYRANSAQANLQSHPCFQSSLFNDKDRATNSVKAWKEKYDFDKVNLLNAANNNDGVKRNYNKDYQLENIIWAQSVKQPRRLTLNNAESITDWEITLLKRQKSYAAAALGELKGKLEEKLTIDALNELHQAFIDADTDGSGTLDLEEFKEVVKNVLKVQGRNEEEIATLFMKINFSCDDSITWDEFCTFMQLNYSEKEDSLKRQKEVVFITPAKIENNPHRSTIQKISCTGDGSFLVMSSDGIFSFWSATGEYKRTRKEIIEKRAIIKDKNDESKRSRQKWMTDFIILTEFNKIVIGTGDRELQFWELSSFEPYCQVCALPTVPIKLAYCCSGRDDVTITYGDTDGCVNIIIFTSIGETLRLWKTQPSSAQMPTIHLDKAVDSNSIKTFRWKSHNDWIEQIRIDRRLNQIISCSNDEQNAVIIGCIIPSTDVNSHLQAASNAALAAEKVAATATTTTANPNEQAGQQNANSTATNATAATNAVSTATSANINLNASMQSTLAVVNPPGGQVNVSNGNSFNISLSQSMDAVAAVNKRQPVVTLQVNPISNKPTTPNTIQLQQQQQQQHQSQQSTAVSQNLLNLKDNKRRPDFNETVFKVNKGVKTFEFSFEKNLLITGGMDRVVRLYNPYIPSKPIAHLKSHNTPIFFIHLCNEDNRIFTMSTDKCLNVWDVIDHSNLSSLRPKSHKINGELQYCHYNSKSKTILINTDKVSFLSLKLKSNLHTEVILSHKEPVIACLFNNIFKHLVSCTENGTVKIWDAETGKDVFEFSNAHGDQNVTCMTFDDTGRRLITGGRDGLCKIWNYNNGHCLKILRKDNTMEISDVRYTRVYNNTFIVCVGWDRTINIFDDDLSDVRVFSDPLPRWTDDIENGHKEDILCLAKSESNFLATSGYDGEVIIWNMVSGHIYAKLNSPRPSNYLDDNLDGDLSVNKLIFFNKDRFSDKTSAHLISSGPRGMIHFWTIFQGTDLIAMFPVSERKGTNVVQMTMNSKFTRLFAADNHGYIYGWDIDGYGYKKKEREPPTLIKTWRAHILNITSLEYLDSAKVLISSATDCTIRVWSPDGKYIGTFGQDETWNLYDAKSYKYPLVPYDVLIDHNSLPDHPLISKRETFQEVLEKTKIDEKEKASAKIQGITRAALIDDEAISNQIRSMGVPSKVGKRLRHEITKPMSTIDKGAKNYYQMLKCFDYDPKPVHVKTPQFLLTKSKY